jgi:hypothetical protein
MKMEQKHILPAVIACFFFALVGIAVLAASAYPGSQFVFFLFNTAYLALLFLALLPPRSYAYLFLAAFLFLGFWAKGALHFVTGSPFIEPTGEFDGSPAAWDEALLYASAGAAGTGLVRGIYLLVSRALVFGAPKTAGLYVPLWYSAWRKPVWIVSLIALATLNAWNFDAAFYQIGVNPRLILPYHLNVLAAWLINVGFAIWFAALVYWESQRHEFIPKTLFAAPVAEGLVSSLSTLSRAAYLLHVIPYLIALAERRTERGFRVTPIAAILVTLLILAGLAASLLAVQVARTHIYFERHGEFARMYRGMTSTEQPATSSGGYGPQLRQILWLFVHRWVGLEGMLAVSSYPGRGMELLRNAILENPKQGIDTLYQKIAGSFYVKSEEFTFLTLPGAMAVLAYSGSLLITLAGMAFITLLLVCTELVAARWLGNAFLLSIIGAAMAHVVCQLNFPYLAAIFLVQLWVALIFLRVVQSHSFSRLATMIFAPPSAKTLANRDPKARG